MACWSSILAISLSTPNLMMKSLICCPPCLNSSIWLWAISVLSPSENIVSNSFLNLSQSAVSSVSIILSCQCWAWKPATPPFIFEVTIMILLSGLVTLLNFRWSCMILHQLANSVHFLVKIPGSPISRALTVSFFGWLWSVSWFVCALVLSFVMSRVRWLVLLLVCAGRVRFPQVRFLLGFGVGVCFKCFWLSVPGEWSFSSFALGAGLLADRFWS
jgi:hypothetical protein